MLPSIRRSFGGSRVVNAAIFSRACSSSSTAALGGSGNSVCDSDDHHDGCHDKQKEVLGVGHTMTAWRYPSKTVSGFLLRGTSNSNGQMGVVGFPVFRRCISVYGPRFNEAGKEGGSDESAAAEEEAGEEESEEKESKGGKGKGNAKKQGVIVARHLDRDRSKKIPVETSIRYLQSEAYREVYGDEPVWVKYRRNFPGQFAPKKTRKMCIRHEQLATGNPCPICRDVYLVVDYRNVDLLKQFISPFTGEVLHWDKTGVCRRQQERLLIEIDRAKDYGTITFDVQFREYDYKEYEKIYATYK